MTHLAKGAIAAATAGTAATGAYVGSTYLSGTSIANQLVKDKYTPISSISNAEHSRQQWAAKFESDVQNIKTLIGFSGDDKVQGGEALEKWCSSKLKENYSETHPSLAGIKKYCVIRNIESQLARQQASILADSDTDKWTATYNKRKSTTKRSPLSQVTGLTGSGSSQPNDDLTKIKNWCNSKAKDSFYAYEDTYDRVYNWCTEKGASVEELS
ncbi:hypothetical protein HF1_04370 [Mycoplasma haemofelis str. Langford 1]|uniref:Uncharacterized protein n=1 Tax=Mycoplasma haemofelis (strain Langford 1) TaxID=941640 RepID=E8ZH24_MYCHL|nr:hypothetical protein [Mycoplasma haemofelis]CBY92445.1 hypothetical protein HF1_04370 [Mycoplasma haemofelis str. Langford 1]